MSEALPHGSPRLLLRYVMAAGMAFFSFGLRAQNTQLLIQNGTTVTVTGGNTIFRNVDLQCNGSWNSTAGLLLVTGGNNTSFSGTGTPQLYTMEIANSQPDTLTLKTGLHVGYALDLHTGFIELNGQTLQLTGPAHLEGESDQSRIMGIHGGRLAAAATGVSAPAQLNVGDLGALLTSAANLGDVAVSRMPTPVVSGGAQGIQRTYLIQPQNNSALNATLRFTYLPSELNGNDPASLDLWKSTDGIGWTHIGADTRDATNHFVEKTGLADLSYWTLSDLTNPLPLTLIRFSAVCAGSYALIQWQTGVESELTDFLIQRSPDGTTWSTLGSVDAQNAATGASYSFKDVTPQPDCFYRLAIAGRDGQTTYSPVFHGGCSDIALPFLVYPNPAVSQAVAQISVRQAVTGKVQVLDLNGQQVYGAVWNLQAGINQLVIPVSSWAAGSYLLRLVLPDGVQQTQIIKQ